MNCSNEYVSQEDVPERQNANTTVHREYGRKPLPNTDTASGDPMQTPWAIPVE